jgi:hypothetical protein
VVGYRYSIAVTSPHFLSIFSFLSFDLSLSLTSCQLNVEEPSGSPFNTSGPCRPGL